MEPTISLPHCYDLPIRSYPEPNHSNPCAYFTSLKSVLLVFSRLCLSLPSGLFPIGFSTKSPYTTFLSPYVLHIWPSHSSWFYHADNIWWGAEIMKIFISQSSSLPCCLVLLRHKYFSQLPLPEHSQPIFLSQCDRPSCTRVYNNKVIILYVLIFILVDNKVKG
jgi:hypothetical protein